MSVKSNVFWLPGAILLSRLLPTCVGMACWDFVPGYSGATASDFNGLPYAFHACKNCDSKNKI